jgi:hypothetical protein
MTFLNKINILLFTITLLISSSSAAETIKESEENEEKFRFPDLFRYNEPVTKSDDEKKWFFTLAGGHTVKNGNTDSTNTTYSGSIKYDDYHTVLRLNYSGSYGKLNGLVNENRGTATGNFDYFIFWRIEFFSYTMSDFNKITLLEHRNGTGAGVKLFLIRNNYLLIDLSGAPILQYEKYEENEAVKDWRWSIRGRAELFPFDEDFSVRYFIYYIPVIGDRKKYRTIQDLFFSKKIAGSLGIRAGYRREFNTYDERAFIENPLLKKTDSTTYIQATLSL